MHLPLPRQAYIDWIRSLPWRNSLTILLVYFNRQPGYHRLDAMTIESIWKIQHFQWQSDNTKYPQIQNDELESQCQHMLEQGLIRYSTSAFWLLVKKQDGSWRFCIDYRALNDNTVKDKFSILVIDELLDELRGATSSLNSTFVQVEKTAFRTHHGHFKFVVMPFGLCNVPSTFQALMNAILGSYLRKFVFVFFDDILIYSKTWLEHLQHIK